jgi:hypothetical protein
MVYRVELKEVSSDQSLLSSFHFYSSLVCIVGFFPEVKIWGASSSSSSSSSSGSSSIGIS